ncbi:MAG: DUF2800 domain-containing protein [Clostridia bacterium]|nr:DUF2800 domain-containing protein [Clostridia bacterium]
MEEHALLSPSSADRWLNCTPSARLESKEPDTSSIYAEEGTLAHKLAEIELKAYIGDYSKRKATIERNKVMKDELFYKGMIDEVDEYVDFCKSSLLSMKADAIMMVEEKLDLGQIAPESYGTGDCVLIDQDHIHIIDLKFGKGQVVEVVDNSQLKLYALGAYQTWGFIYDTIKEIWVTIAQVRLGEINTFKISVDDLIKWGLEIKPIAEKAYSGKGDRKAGAWCRFCKVRYSCKARADFALDGLDEAADPYMMTFSDIAKYLDKVTLVKDLLKDLEDYALDLALQGEHIPGYKVVEGRSNRKIVDEEGLAKSLIESGYSEDKIYKPKQIETITALTKLLGKKKFEELSKDYIEKPQGKPTLVPESDKRPPIDSAVNEFEFN